MLTKPMTREVDSKVWIASGQSGLENRQYTIQLTMLADGKTLPRLLSFEDKVYVKKEWDRRVKVVFQPKS